jgi:hypothetical protein
MLLRLECTAVVVGMEAGTRGYVIRHVRSVREIMTRGKDRRATEQGGNRWAIPPLLVVVLGVLAFPQQSSGEESIIGSPFAVLDHGEKGGYEWRVYTSPMSKRRGQSLPCINVSVERELRPVSEAATFSSCGSIKPFPTVTKVGAGVGLKRVVVAGMAFDREVHTVKYRLSDGRTATRRARLISARAARKAHVTRFAFLAVAVARGLSIGRIVGYDASGRAVAGVVKT